MFQFLQIFLFLSFLIVTGVTGVGGWYLGTLANQQYNQFMAQNNSALAHGYIFGVWSKYRDTMLPLLSDPRLLQSDPNVAQFAKDSYGYFSQTSVTRVNIYSANGMLLISDSVTKAGQLLGNAASPNKEAVAAYVQNPQAMQTHVLRNIPVQGAEHGIMLQALLPIRVGDNPKQPADGVIEILVNVTETFEQMQMIQYATIGGYSGGFLLFWLVAFLGFRKAELVIAKQHETNLELSQATADALAQSQEKSNFLTNISHELRTPLNAIIGFSDVIKAELLPKLEERKYDQYVNDIYSAGVHLLSLINDILDYSKAEAGKLALEVSEVDVSKMVQNCIRLVSPRAASGDVKLSDEMPKEHIVMVIDGKKFKQVMLNLLSNAVKFTPAGGSVSVTAWQNMIQDSVTFVVMDTGIGIAAKDISRAMSPFGQVDNTLKRKYEGTGLGLPLTKKFVELMGGEFTIESTVGKGTKVIFSLPRETKERDGVIVKKVN